MRMTFGEACYRARKKKRLTTGDIGSLVGLTRAAVSAWESEATAPTLFNAMIVSRYLGFSLDELEPKLTSAGHHKKVKIETQIAKLQEKLAKLETNQTKGMG